MNQLDLLRRTIAEKEHPGLVRCKPPSHRERCEARATVAFALGVEATKLSQRAVARVIGVDERIVRDYLSGARAVPTWAGMALPRDGQVAFVRGLVEQIPEAQEELQSTGSDDR